MTYRDGNTGAGRSRIMGRSRRLPSSQRKVFDRIFHSDGGYVLDFSTNNMFDWFEENFGINIFQERFQSEGTSKGKTLRGFVETAEPRLVAQVLLGLWQYRCQLDGYTESDPSKEAELKTWINQFAAELENSSSMNLEGALKDFSADTTLPKLRASIEADLVAEKPDVAVDRVHTYCVKRFRSLLDSHNRAVGVKTPLHACFGSYVRAITDAGLLSEFAQPALHGQNKLFEALNNARNKRSFAHDNDLLAVSEAQFIIECVLTSLAFIERIEAQREYQDTETDDDFPF